MTIDLERAKYSYSPPTLLGLLAKKFLKSDPYSMKMTCYMRDMELRKALGETHNRA